MAECHLTLAAFLDHPKPVGPPGIPPVSPMASPPLAKTVYKCTGYYICRLKERTYGASCSKWMQRRNTHLRIFLYSEFKRTVSRKREKAPVKVRFNLNTF